MLYERLNASNYSFIEKLKSIDYFLILIVLSIGSISVFSIYSTESGNFSYFTKNHLIRLVLFFSMFSCSSSVSTLISTGKVYSYAKALQDKSEICQFF